MKNMNMSFFSAESMVHVKSRGFSNPLNDASNKKTPSDFPSLFPIQPYFLRAPSKIPHPFHYYIKTPFLLSLLWDYIFSRKKDTHIMHIAVVLKSKNAYYYEAANFFFFVFGCHHLALASFEEDHDSFFLLSCACALVV